MKCRQCTFPSFTMLVGRDSHEMVSCICFLWLLIKEEIRLGPCFLDVICLDAEPFTSLSLMLVPTESSFVLNAATWVSKGVEGLACNARTNYNRRIILRYTKKKCKTILVGLQFILVRVCSG